MRISDWSSDVCSSDLIDIIRRVFPDAKIVHLVRDGRDVVLSQRSIEWMSGNLPKLVLDWQWKTTIAHKVGAVLGDDFLEVRYEDLVCRPEAILRQICAFIDEPYASGMLRSDEHTSELQSLMRISYAVFCLKK